MIRLIFQGMQSAPRDLNLGRPPFPKRYLSTDLQTREPIASATSTPRMHSFHSFCAGICFRTNRLAPFLWPLAILPRLNSVRPKENLISASFLERSFPFGNSIASRHSRELRIRSKRPSAVCRVALYKDKAKSNFRFRNRTTSSLSLIGNSRTKTCVLIRLHYGSPAFSEQSRLWITAFLFLP